MGYKDKEKAAAYAREWRANHADKVRADDRVRREKERIKNPAAASVRTFKWRAAHPDGAKFHAWKQNEKQKLRRKNDPAYGAMLRERQKQVRSDPEKKAKMQAYDREWRKEERANFPERQWKRTLNSMYGITPDQYKAMELAQGGKCAICGIADPKTKRSKHWHIDHCHTTNQVRGLLCHGCNTGLGSFKDDTERLRLAIAYLEKHR